MLFLSITSTATGAMAGPFDGVFRPDKPFADTWNCSEEFMGQDGGSVGISNGYLYGVENTCELTNERPIDGENASHFTAICSGEGMTDIVEMVIVKWLGLFEPYPRVS